MTGDLAMREQAVQTDRRLAHAVQSGAGIDQRLALRRVRATDRAVRQRGPHRTLMQAIATKTASR